MRNKQQIIEDLEKALKVIYKEYGSLRQIDFKNHCFIFSKVKGDIVEFDKNRMRFNSIHKDGYLFCCVNLNYGNPKTVDISLTRRNGSLYLLRKQLVFESWNFNQNKTQEYIQVIIDLANHINHKNRLENTLSKKPELNPKKIVKI